MTATSTTTDTITVSEDTRKWIVDYALRMSAQDEGGERDE